MGVVRVKDGVEFAVIAPGGFRILSAIEQVASVICDLTITSGCDGERSGPSDPHHSGNAYDVRSHDLDAETKPKVLDAVMRVLGWDRFWGEVEFPGTDNEHFHFQVKKGTQYP